MSYKYPISGIYKFTCLNTGKVYVGSATYIVQRRGTHLHALRHNKHINKYFQAAFNKYGL